jgi:hypothetical protein
MAPAPRLAQAGAQLVVGAAEVPRHGLDVAEVDDVEDLHRVEPERHVRPAAASRLVGHADGTRPEPRPGPARRPVVERRPEDGDVDALQPRRVEHEPPPGEGGRHAGVRRLAAAARPGGRWRGRSPAGNDRAAWIRRSRGSRSPATRAADITGGFPPSPPARPEAP